MRSFMSSFSAFVIHLSGYKKKVANPVRRDKYIEKLRIKNRKEVSLPPYPYKTKPQKINVNGVEVFCFAKEKNKKIIYLHGGAFCEQPLLPHFMFCDKIAAKSDYSVLMPVYKKAPDHTYIETYDFLGKYYQDILKNTPACDIVFMGDSSGGGLALSFCEYLNEKGLPIPSGLILLSPWLDISMDEPFLPEFDKVDPSLQHDFLKLAGQNWAGDADTHDYKLSPIYGDIKSLPPTTVFFGTYEAFVTDARRFKSICDEQNVDINYYEYERMNHCFPIYPIPEAKKAQKQILQLLSDKKI